MTRWKMALAVLSCAMLCLSGCALWRGERVVLVPPGEPVRLAAPTTAEVWVADKDGKEIKGTVTLPEGWWCLPLPEQKEEPK